MGDYHPQGTMEKSVSIYLKRRSITGSCGAGHCGAGHFIRQRRAKKDSAVVNGNTT